MCGGTSERGEGEWRRLRKWGNMVDGFYIHIRNRAMNIQWKSNQNCHNDFPLYKKYNNKKWEEKK
jgi:hypothetical protein